jgi:heme-degrading monooxygenase HmoA
MFLRLWQFRAAPGNEAEFEARYGPDGAWARLFLKGAGYLGTELLSDAAGSGEYVTIDRWESAEAWVGFLDLHREAYDELDRDSERLCSLDARIGEFITSAAPSHETP